MKKILSVFGGLVLSGIVLMQHTKAFSDISNESKLYPIIQNLVSRGIISDGTYFGVNETVPANMFWKTILLDSGFDPNLFTAKTEELPKNFPANDPEASFIAYAVRLGFIDSRQEYDKNKPITRVEALKVLLFMKNIEIADAVSLEFQNLAQGVFDGSKSLLIFEAGYASQILEETDISPIRPLAFLSRQDFATWLWRSNQHGTQKSKLDSSLEKKTDLTQPKKAEESIIPEETSTDKKATAPVTVRVLPIKNTKNKNNSVSRTLLPSGDILEAVFAEIESDYRFADVLTSAKKEKMINAAIVAMVKEIGDQYSSFIAPEESEDFKNGLAGQFEGIGAFVELINDKFTITSPIKGSPAEMAGLLADDVITTVDGQSITDKSVQESIALIKGQAGTTVKLTVLRAGKELQVEVIRGKIIVPSVTIEWQKNIPVIGIHQFNNETTELFSKIINNEILPKKPKGMVLDFRNNPGGFLTSAVTMGEFFLNKDDVVFSVEFKDNFKNNISTRKGELYDLWKNGDMEIMVLQNKGSASATEIFTTMIQDYKIGKVIGTVSRGKGTVQEIKNYSNGGILKLTIAKWMSPKGRWIHEIGVSPDIEVESPTTEDKAKKIDAQLERALAEILY